MIADTLSQQVEDERTAWDERNVALAAVEQHVEAGDKVPYIFDIFGIHVEVEDQVVEDDLTDEGVERALKAVFDTYRAEEEKHGGRHDKIDMEDISIGIAGDDNKLLVRFAEVGDDDQPTAFGVWLQALIDANNDEWLSKSPAVEDDEEYDDDEADDEEDDA
jgi:hypothetical protein